jgi:broad specificity phosphatase PhoE
MLNTASQIQEVQSLQNFLLFTVRHVKSLHATLTAVMTDVAALRRTLLEEPGNVVDYKSNLRAAIETAKPLVDEAMLSYDEMIRQIQSLEEWRN